MLLISHYEEETFISVSVLEQDSISTDVTHNLLKVSFYETVFGQFLIKSE